MDRLLHEVDILATVRKCRYSPLSLPNLSSWGWPSKSGWLNGCLAGWQLPGWLAGLAGKLWQVGSLTGLAGRLAGWLQRLFPFRALGPKNAFPCLCVGLDRAAIYIANEQFGPKIQQIQLYARVKFLEKEKNIFWDPQNGKAENPKIGRFFQILTYKNHFMSFLIL